MAVGATILGSFGARLGIDTGEYSRGILSAQAVTQVFGQTFTTFLTNPLLGSIQIIKNVGGAFVRYSGQVLEHSEAMQRLADRTGLSTDLTQAFAAAAERAGYSVSTLETAAAKFAKTLGDAQSGDKTARSYFEDIGLDPDQIGNVSNGMTAVLDRLRDLDAARRAAAGGDFFGVRAGGEFVDAINGSAASIRALVDEERKLGSIVDEDELRRLSAANTLVAKINDGLGGIGRQFTVGLLAGFFEEFGTDASSIEDATSHLGERFAQVGTDLGTKLGDLIGTIDDVVRRIEQIIDIIDKRWDVGASAVLHPHFMSGYDPYPHDTSFLEGMPPVSQEYLREHTVPYTPTGWETISR